MNRNFFLEVGRYRLGYQYSPIIVNGNTYMVRHILYLGLCTLRAHHFFRGDDDRAPHSHPWVFVTFPFADYLEEVFDETGFVESRWVKRFRFHLRNKSFRHIVKFGNKGRPFWTLVLAGPVSQEWGFYPRPDKFVSWKEWPSGTAN